MKKYFKKIPDFLYFVIGPAMTASNLFAIKHVTEGNGYPDYHIYSDEARSWIFIGIGLICLGLLKYYKKKHNIE